jgi:hypothetical protein
MLAENFHHFNVPAILDYMASFQPRQAFFHDYGIYSGNNFNALFGEYRIIGYLPRSDANSFRIP